MTLIGKNSTHIHPNLKAYCSGRNNGHHALEGNTYNAIQHPLNSSHVDNYTTSYKFKFKKVLYYALGETYGGALSPFCK